MNIQTYIFISYFDYITARHGTKIWRYRDSYPDFEVYYYFQIVHPISFIFFLFKELHNNLSSHCSLAHLNNSQEMPNQHQIRNVYSN